MTILAHGKTEVSRETLAVQLNRWLQETEASIPERNWRTESMEDYRFYAGKHDSAEVLAALHALKRPATVYNEIKPKIDMLIGLAAQVEGKPTLRPVGAEDEPLTELMNGVMHHFRRELKLKRKELDCFEHTVKGGRSFLHYYIDMENPFEPQIKCIRVQGRNVYLDPNSVEYDMSDARYIFIEKWLTEDVVKAMWPGLKLTDIKEGGATNYDGPVYFDEVRELYRVVECWYRKLERVYWFVNPLTNKPEFLRPDEFKEYNQGLKAGLQLPNGEELKLPEGLDYTVSHKKMIHYAILAGSKIVEMGESPYKHDQFPYVLFGAYKDEDENRWFSSISMQKDPQRGLNTTRRQLTHLLQTAPRGILMHEVGAILDIDEYEKRSTDPTYHMEVAKNTLDRVKFSSQPQISPIYQHLDGMSQQSMKDVSGIQNDMMGVQTFSREPGVTVQTRQETSMAVLFVLYDNFKESKHNAAKQLLSMIQQYVSAEMAIRIEGPEGEMLMQINSQMNPGLEGWNDVSTGKFDMDMGEDIETSTSRLATFRMLSEYAATNQGAIPPDVLMDYSKLPFTAKQRIREYFSQQQQIELDQFEAGQKLEYAKIAAKNESPKKETKKDG